MCNIQSLCNLGRAEKQSSCWSCSFLKYANMGGMVSQRWALLPHREWDWCLILVFHEWSLDSLQMSVRLTLGFSSFSPTAQRFIQIRLCEIAYLCFVMRWSGKLSVMFLCHLPVHVHTHSPSWLGIIRISCRGTELKIQIIQNCLSVWFHERQSFQKRLLYTSLTPLTAAVSQWCQC